MLIVGQQAPDFKATTQDGAIIRLSEFRGNFVVLYFYPKGFTPGCTKEACAFRDVFHDLRSLGTVILGINLESPSQHKVFQQKYGFSFSLLSDPMGEIISSYDAWNRWKMFGKWFGAIDRSTFVIDEEGRVRRIWRNVKVRGHIDEVFEFLKTLQGLKTTFAHQIHHIR